MSNLNIAECVKQGVLFDGHYKMIRQLNDKKAAVAIWQARDMNTIDINAAANDVSSGKLVSLMICHPNAALNIEEEQRWQDEFDAAQDCLHPNLIPPETYAVLSETYYLVFPYTETESLRQFIGKSMSDTLTWKLISDIASGLNELHTHQPPIIHNDIKPSNILVFDNQDFALTNYGIRFETDLQRIENQSDSLSYMAPERFQAASTPRPESDIWALGATLYEILSRKKPFGEEGGKNQQPDTPMPPLSDQPDRIRELVYACLQADPEKRPTAKQIKDAARSKKLSIKSNKPKSKSQSHQAKAASGKDKPHKKWPIAVAAAALLLIGMLVYLLIPHHNDNPSTEIEKKETEKTVVVNYYEKAVSLLSDKSTATAGRALLDSLASANDWQATFLLSRLYFDTRGKDTVFYDKHWAIMRDNCGITPDNARAHNYLFNAYELNENDFMILYQLGCDFKAGAIRGCERNLDYALWCFDHAENILKSTGVDPARYQQELNHGRDRISTSDHTPLKPSR